MAPRSRSLILVPAIIGTCLFLGTLQVVSVAVSGPPWMAPQASQAWRVPRADRDADRDADISSGPALDDRTIDAGLIEVPSASADAISL